MSSAMIITMVLCFAFSISVAVSIGLAAILGLQWQGVNLFELPRQAFLAIDKFPLVAIPFFIL
ncbi:MAG: C4-dicarboxylate ABC transporter permease, partial [Betaproteobacteria bacterium]